MDEIVTISEIRFEEEQMTQATEWLGRLGPVETYNSRTTKLLKRGVPELGVPFTTIEVTSTEDTISARHPGKAIKSESNISSSILCSSVVYDSPVDFLRLLGYKVTMETAKSGQKTLFNGVQVAVYLSSGSGVLEFSTTSSKEVLKEVYTTIKDLQRRFRQVIT